MNSLDDDDNVALAETATIGGGAAANLCGGGRKSSSKTGEPGESLSSLTVSGSVGVRWLGRPPPNASLKVLHVTKTARYSACFARTSDGKAINPLLAVGTLLKFDYSFQWMAVLMSRFRCFPVAPFTEANGWLLLDLGSEVIDFALNSRGGATDRKERKGTW